MLKFKQLLIMDYSKILKISNLFEVTVAQPQLFDSLLDVQGMEFLNCI